MLQASTLVPGLLVSLKTSVRGNVAYARLDIEPEHVTAEGEKRAKWETEKTVTDPVEHDAAIKVRSKATAMIRGTCAASTFGLLCPVAQTDKLERAIQEAREMAEAFNRTAKLTQVRIFVLAGRVASDDPEAIRAINSEIRDLLANMELGVSKLDVESIRDAANRAKQLGNMLSPKAQQELGNAISAVRSTARKIVKAEEGASLEVDSQTLEAIRSARTQFLDMDESQELGEAVTVARAIELEPEAAPETQGTVPTPESTLVAVPMFELD